MIWLYRLLFLPALICSLPYYVWRMFRRGGYRHDFHHRFGLIDRPPPKPAGTRRIWVQAVSVGEAQALGPFLKNLCARPDREIILTTTTSTAYKLLRERFADKVLKTGIFPLDFWPFSRNAWRRLNPDLAILMEAELWPEHLANAQARGVPVVLINARMSDRSFARYRMFPRVARGLLNQVRLILCATPQDHERFLALGANPANTHITGSLKFDVPAGRMLNTTERAALREEMGFVDATGMSTPPASVLEPEERRVGDDPPCLVDASAGRASRKAGDAPLVLLGSSTWDGEEALLIEVLEGAIAAGLDARLLLVPRHAERRKEITAVLEKQPLAWHVRSISPLAPQPVKIYLADTTGELARLTQAADVAFIGKSLPPHDGGQTPIEAAALGLPMVYGPNMSNFRDICRGLEDAGAAIRAEDATGVTISLLCLLQNSARRAKMGTAARAFHAANQGATARTVAAIEELLK